MKDTIKAILQKIGRQFIADLAWVDRRIEASMVLQGKILSYRNSQILQNLRAQKLVSNGGGGNTFFLENAEFKIFSQNGEDGMIDFLIQALDSENLLRDYADAFIEFGVQDYKECNTRYLLRERNFQGLIMDGSQKYIDTIKKDFVHHAHDLEAKCAFITRDNINGLISDWLKSRQLGRKITLLSIDIDGNDYYVWDAINCIDPAIVVIEYNGVFDPKTCVTIPYKDDFYRYDAHHSGLYFGASVGALVKLGAKKGYKFVGADSNGINLFFVRDEFADAIDFISVRDFEHYRKMHRVRQSLDKNKRATFLYGESRWEEIKHLPLVEV